MDGIVKSPIGFAVSDQLGIPLFITRLEFLYDGVVGLACVSGIWCLCRTDAITGYDSGFIWSD